MQEDIYWRREWLKEKLYSSHAKRTGSHKLVYISSTTSEVNFCVRMPKAHQWYQVIAL
jgi:hypothetical protein